MIRAVQIAKQVEGPVKVIWTREEDIQHDMYRPYFYDRLAAGLDAEGMPIAWSHRITGSSILGRWLPAGFQNGFDGETVDGAAQPPYALPNILVDYVRHEPPRIPTAFWRGVGPTHNIFMVESFIDELAAAAKKDPVAYRRARCSTEIRGHKQCSSLRRKRQSGAKRYRRVLAAGCHFSSRSELTWLRSPT